MGTCVHPHICRHTVPGPCFCGRGKGPEGHWMLKTDPVTHIPLFLYATPSCKTGRSNFTHLAGRCQARYLRAPRLVQVMSITGPEVLFQIRPVMASTCLAISQITSGSTGPFMYPVKQSRAGSVCLSPARGQWPRTL